MKKNRYFTKRITAVLMSACLIVTGSAQVFATTISNAQSEKAEAEENLDSVNDQISDIESQQSSLQSEIDALDSELVLTIANISILEDEIVSKQAELEQATADLAEAEEKEAEQYASMKERISYMYINGGEISFFSALLGASSFADALNRVQMFASVYSFDRSLLQEYEETVAEVEELIEEVSEEEAALQDQQSELESQKSSLNTMITEKSAEMDDFDIMLAEAQSLAAEYKATIEEQTELIAQEVAAQQAAAAEKAARIAAAESSLDSSSSDSSSSDDSSGSSTSTDAGISGSSSSSDNNILTSSSSKSSDATTGSSTSTGSSSSTSSSTSTGSDATTGSSSSTGSSTSTGSSSSTSSSSSTGSSSSTSSSSSTASGSGQAVADYACQFVGNPYVWGGESLTNGADCSGFVKAVYAHFGVSLPHSSYSLRSVGYAVSASEMQPGDIVCYEGHVAIYIGGGAIVHAASASTGIKISYNYAYRTVVAIRRIF